MTGRRIVQAWRTTKFMPADPDSQIEVLLEPAPGGTRVTVNYTNVPTATRATATAAGRAITSRR